MNISSLFGAVAQPEAPAHFISKILEWVFSWVGDYGWAVVVFTLIVTLALLPLDIWQKTVMLKNNKIMKVMRPQMEKLQKQYGNNKTMLQQKQMELYKKNKYSMVGACLPMIITLVLFFIIFSGFSQTTRYHAELEYSKAVSVYDEATDAYRQYLIENNLEDDPVLSSNVAFEAKGAEAVTENVQPTGFLWIGNVFMPDNWSSKVPSYATFKGTGLGNVGAFPDTNISVDEYNLVMDPLREANPGWNGYLILPILSVGLNFLSQFLNRKFTAQSAQMNAADSGAMSPNSMKYMMFIMPIVMGIFALLYSSAFTLYIFTRALFSSVFQLGFNVVTKIKDKREEDLRLSTTFKR